MQRLRMKPDFTTLLTLVAGLLLFACPLMAEDTPTLQMAPVNPAFTDFMLHIPAMQRAASLLQSQSNGMGYIPSPVDRSHLKGVTSVTEFAAIQGTASLPASYDLRTLGRVTPVRNQGGCGSCWAFGTMASLESTLMPAEPSDFSENNLKNTAGFDWGPCDGGNADISTAYLMRWSGPINESDDPYSAASTSSPTGRITQKHEQNVIRLPLRTGSLDNDTIKSAVTNYGALYVSMYYGDSYYSAANHAYYYNGSQSYGNHAVAIVGWDDAFDKNKFSPAAPGNGAFIIKNSWGASWGDNGYFYISYYDKIMGFDELVAFTAPENTTDYTRVYSYDPLGVVGGRGYGSNTAWFANVFTAQGNEQIEAVSFYNAGQNSPYIVYVYKDLTNSANPRSGTLVSTNTGTLSDAGYLTIPLATPVPVTSGEVFSVVVKLTTPGYNAPIPVEYAYPGYSSGATASPGQSFISSGGSSWTDTVNVNATENVCIKAYALSGASGYSMSGTVRSGSAAGAVISGAHVSLAGKNATTNSSGAFTITGIAAGTYVLSIDATGYSNYTDNSFTVDSDLSGLNFYTTLTGSVIINNESPYTKSRTVTLTLSSPAAKFMQFSNDDTVWSAWESFKTIKSWSIAPGDGSKTVYIHFKDVAGEPSPAYSATIMLDTTAPVNGTLTPAQLAGNQIQLDWTGFSDATSGLASYKLVRGTALPAASCTGAAIFTPAAADTEYIDTDLSLKGGVTYFYRLCAVDNAGNVSSGATASAKAVPELTKPSGTTVAINQGPITNKAAVTLNLTASDDTKVAAYCISNTSTCTAWTTVATPGTTLSIPAKPWTLAAGADGNRTVSVWYKDVWGNVSDTASASTTLDKTPPVNGTLTPTQLVGNQIQLDWAGFSDATSGLASYKLVRGTALPAASCTGATIFTPAAADTEYIDTDLSLKGGVTYFYRLCALDKAGNASSGATASAKAVPELTKPSGTTVAINQGPITNKTAVTLNLTASDASKVAAYCISNTATCTAWTSVATPGTTLSIPAKPWTLAAGADGVRHVSVWYKDVWGNVSDPSSASTTLDTTKPAGAISIDEGATTTNTVINLTLSATDTGSGVDSMRFSKDKITWLQWVGYDTSSSYTLSSAKGQKTVYVQFRDKAGNVSPIYSATITLQ